MHLNLSLRHVCDWKVEIAVDLKRIDDFFAGSFLHMKHFEMDFFSGRALVPSMQFGGPRVVEASRGFYQFG